MSPKGPPSFFCAFCNKLEFQKAQTVQTVSKSVKLFEKLCAFSALDVAPTFAVPGLSMIHLVIKSLPSLKKCRLMKAWFSKVC